MNHTVAIIPARGGSKRVPDKNIRLFDGVPMIHYAIRAAEQSGLFDRIIVSTDSEAIAKIAREAGAEIPFMRPARLADDLTVTATVIRHALEELGEGYEFACCIYATVPFLRPRDLIDGYEKIRSTRVGSVFPVGSFGFPIFRALRIDDGGTLSMFWPEHRDTRSNDLPTAYHDAGQFYWLNVKRFLDDPMLYYHDSMPVIIPRWLVHDIDCEEDLRIAELAYQILKSRHELE